MKTYLPRLVIGVLVLIFSKTAYSVGYCDSLTETDDLTRFHRAVCNADVEATKEFLRKGVDVNKMYTANVQFWDRNNRYEFNALHTALNEFYTNNKNYKQIIQLLIEHGINAETTYKYWYSNNINSEPIHLSEYRPIGLTRSREIEKLLAQGGAKISPLVFIKSEGVYERYRGRITVSGEISIDPNDEFQGGSLCMSVDDATSHLIPRLGDTRSTWFCFENDEEAIKVLKIDRKRIHSECFSGKITAEVSDYQQYRGESEETDMAKLVRVLKSKNFVYKKCSSN